MNEQEQRNSEEICIEWDRRIDTVSIGQLVAAISVIHPFILLANCRFVSSVSRNHFIHLNSTCVTLHAPHPTS